MSKKQTSKTGRSYTALSAIMRRGGVHQDQKAKADPKQTRRDKRYKQEDRA